MRFCFCIHGGGVFVDPVGFRKRINNYSLPWYRVIGRSVFYKHANTAVYAGQTDPTALYGHQFLSNLGNVAFRYQGNIARGSCRVLPTLAGQFGNDDIAGQFLSFYRTARNIHINIAAVIRDSTKRNPVFGSIDFLPFRILRTGIDPFTYRRDMDIFNIILCPQVSTACCQTGTTLLDDAATCRLNCQRRVFRIVSDITIQIDVTSYCIRVSYRDASIFLADKTHIDRTISFQRESVRLRGTIFGSPCRMV